MLSAPFAPPHLLRRDDILQGTAARPNDGALVRRLASGYIGLCTVLTHHQLAPPPASHADTPPSMLPV